MKLASATLEDYILVCALYLQANHDDFLISQLQHILILMWLSLSKHDLESELYNSMSIAFCICHMLPHLRYNRRHMHQMRHISICPPEIWLLTSQSSTSSLSWPRFSTATSMPSLDGVYFNIHSKQHGNIRPSHHQRSVEDYFFDRSPSISKRSPAGPTSFSPLQRAKSAGCFIDPGPNRTVNQQKNGKNADYGKGLSKRELFPALQNHIGFLTCNPLREDSMAKRRINWQGESRESLLCPECDHGWSYGSQTSGTSSDSQWPQEGRFEKDGRSPCGWTWETERTRPSKYCSIPGIWREPRNRQYVGVPHRYISSKHSKLLDFFNTFPEGLLVVASAIMESSRRK